MPRKYRKKPVVVEAVQFPNRDDYPTAAIDWLHDNFAGHNYDPIDHVIYIKTLEGVMKAVPGDYIIKDIQGEFCPCRPDIFEATYEVADA